jgi:hydroxyacylglutathione hydrolase
MNKHGYANPDVLVESLQDFGSLKADVFIEQFVDEGLGNSAYLVGSLETKQVVLIDPSRDVDRYLATAAGMGLTITHVLETHLHADFVSGAREMAARAGALVGASAEAGLEFDHRPLVENDFIPLGPFDLRVLATPGHAPEHISFILDEAETGRRRALFSGGALIVGGAARTDLVDPEFTRPLAHRLYHTLHDKLLHLPDDVKVYPTHGAGSFCARPTNGHVHRVTTVSHERRYNPLAQLKDEEAFVEGALSDLPSYPPYFKQLRRVNKRGPRVLGGIPPLTPRTPLKVYEWQAQGGMIVDTRPVHASGEAFITDSIRIPLSTSFATWVGWLIPFGASLVLVADKPDDREEAVRQLSRIGYDCVHGYLDGGLPAWDAAGLPVEPLKTIPVSELHNRLGRNDAPLVLDVRQDAEWRMGHIPGAMHIENGQLPYDALSLPTDRLIAVHCQTQHRSAAAVSILARRGYRNLSLVEGGFSAWRAAGFPIETVLKTFEVPETSDV